MNDTLAQPLPAPALDVDLPLPDRRAGKVRVSYAMPGDPSRRVFVTTDRLSAFDRIITGIPYKGQVLNELAAWWFTTTRDIVANHFIASPDPNVTIARSVTPLPVEVIVRHAITGVTTTSVWQRYADGARTIDGYDFPDGLSKNTELPRPIITPTTKAADGGHDEPLSCADVVARGLLEPELWERVQAAALAVFDRGRSIAAEAGLILADTKYEFGLDVATGDLLLIDEVHTPDSSRFWMAESYAARLAAGDEPESLDKEFVRRAFADLGYTGHGAPPTLAPEVWSATAGRYVLAYERITGEAFAPAPYPVPPRLTDNLTKAGLL